MKTRIDAAVSAAAVVAYREGHAVVVLMLTIRDGLIEHIHAVGDARKLEHLLSPSP